MLQCLSKLLLCPAETWLLQELTEEFRKDYGVELSQEVDYSIAVVQSNPHHQV